MYNDYEYEYYDDYDDYEEDKKIDFIPILGTISKWYIRIGLVIAVILFLYFLFTKALTAFVFLLGLVVAFFFGYFFVLILDFIVTKINT